MIFEFDGFGFKFGIYSSAITQKVSGRTIGDLFKSMSDEHEVTLALIHYFYGAAVSYNESKGLKNNVTLDSIGDLIEKIGFEKAMEVFRDSLQLPKNSEAPKETGQA